METDKIIVIGIGHPMRGDDAIGSLAIDSLQDKLPKSIQLYKCLGDMAELIEYFQDYSQVYLIDAMQTEQHPVGSIIRFTLDDRFDFINHCNTSTHAFDLGQTIEMAKNLDCLPEQLIIYGIEAKNFAEESGLSGEVNQSLPKLVEQILQEVKNNDKGITHA